MPTESRTYRPHCKFVVVAQPPGEMVRWRIPALPLDEFSRRDFDTLHANRCTHGITGKVLEVYGSAGSININIKSPHCDYSRAMDGG